MILFRKMFFMPAMSTGLAALIVLLLAMKMTGKREIGLYAACCFLLMPLVFIIGTFCTLDAIFSLFITATVASFYCAVEGCLEKNRVKCLSWLAATGEKVVFVPPFKATPVIHVFGGLKLREATPGHALFEAQDKVAGSFMAIGE